MSIEKYQDFTTVYANGFYNGEEKWKNKIRAKIEELNNEFNERNSHEEDFNYNYGEEYAFAEEKLKELLEEE